MRTWLVALTLGLALTGPAVTASTVAAAQEAPECSPEALAVREEALGGSLVLGAFTAAGYLGSLADQLEHKGLTQDQVLIRAAGTAGALSASVEQIKTLQASGTLADNDKDLIERMRKLYESLQSQAKHLSTFAQSGDKAAAKSFREERETSWKELVAMMGLNDMVAKQAAPGGSSLGLPKGH